MQKLTEGKVCRIDGAVLTTTGSRKELMRGEVDAISTDIGMVCRNCLDEYDGSLNTSIAMLNRSRQPRRRRLENF